MPCKACHKPKGTQLVIGNRYTGPHGQYVFSEIDDDLYAFVNLKSGQTWSGAKSLNEIKLDADRFTELRRN